MDVAKKKKLNASCYKMILDIPLNLRSEQSLTSFPFLGKASEYYTFNLGPVDPTELRYMSLHSLVGARWFTEWFESVFDG